MARPWIITVAGSRTHAGKTALVERLLPFLGPCVAIKARVEETEDAEILREAHADANAKKDTGRYLAAGARRAYLVSGPPEKAAEAVKRIAREEDGAGVVVESNALFRRLAADLSIFVAADGPAKPGTDELAAKADMIVRVNPEWERSVS